MRVASVLCFTCRVCSMLLCGGFCLALYREMDRESSRTVWTGGQRKFLHCMDRWTEKVLVLYGQVDRSLRCSGAVTCNVSPFF